MSVIETSRLSLREVSVADAEFIFTLMTGQAYLQFIGDRGIRTVKDAEEYIRGKFVPSYRKFGYGSYLVELKPAARPIGVCGFVRRDSLDHPDIGFAFVREYWGHGFAYEAAGAVLDYGFEQLGMRVVLGITSPENHASIRLLEKLGLRYQKMFRVPPKNHDSMLFSVEGKRPNKAPEPTSTAVTPRAEPRVMPVPPVAHL
jgi:RimJ/RimL family protein N-acetyltransferase